MVGYHRYSASSNSVERHHSRRRKKWHCLVVDEWICDNEAYQLSISVDSIGRLYALDGSSPEVSIDSGATWKSFGSSNKVDLWEAASYGFIGFQNNGAAVAVSYDSGRMVQYILPLSNNLEIDEVAVDPTGTIQAFDGIGGIWSSSDHGATWRRRMNRNEIQGQLMEDGNYYAHSPFSDSTNYINYVSYDGGATYKQLNVPPGVGRAGIYASPNGILWLTYGSERFMRSTDSGSTWADFVHFTDPAPAYWHLDSGETWGMVQRGQNLWFATLAAIHFTSDDGATWRVDTPNFPINGITGGSGNSAIVLSDGEGIHLLSPGESPDSGWLQPNGAFAENPDGTMLQINIPFYQFQPETFIRESKSGDILDTLCSEPDSLFFTNFVDQTGAMIAIDSFGNIFGATTMTTIGTTRYTNVGLYRFISASAFVAKQPSPSGDLDVSVTNNVLTITSSDEIQSAEMFDVTGRSLIKIPSAHSTMLSASVASVPSGVYLVKAEISDGTIVRKVMIAH